MTDLPSPILILSWNLDGAAAAARHQIDVEIDWSENIDYFAIARAIIESAIGESRPVTEESNVG